MVRCITVQLRIGIDYTNLFPRALEANGEVELYIITTSERKTLGFHLVKNSKIRLIIQ